MEPCLCGPAVPEKADGDDEAAGNDERNAVFRSGDAPGTLCEAGPEVVSQSTANLAREAVTEGEGEIVVAALGDGLVVVVGEEGGEG